MGSFQVAVTTVPATSSPVRPVPVTVLPVNRLRSNALETAEYAAEGALAARWSEPERERLAKLLAAVR